MKTILYTLLLCIPQICMSNSSWAPINPEYKYHFVLSDSISWLLNSNLKNARTIRVVSSGQANGEHVYQLNTILNESSTRYRQAQFLQQEMVIQGNGDVHFRTPGSILFKTNTSTGQSWMLDTLAGVTATQIEAVQETHYGQTDSVRIFLLSSGDTIRLAKDHGLIQYPYQYGSGIYYRQVGVSGLNRGFVSPDFFDCYDFEPGDRFEYRSSVSHGYGGTTRTTQFSVISRDDSYEGGVRYEVEGFARVTSNDHGNNTITYSRFDEFERQESLYEHLNYYNREWIFESQFSTISSVKSGFFKGNADLITKSINIHDSQPRLCNLPSDPDSLCCDYCEYPPFEDRRYSHGKGIGLISSSSYVPDYSFTKELVAVRKKNFSYGEFTPLNYFTEDGENLANTKSYPNPANNEVRIIMTPYDPNSTLILSDSSGRILMKRSFKWGPTLNLDISHFAPGLYVYLIRNEAGKFNGYGKFVKASF